MRLMLWFPFGPPSCHATPLENGPARVAFDVLRCPLALHFSRAGAPYLCAASFCRVDERLAEEWGLRFGRSTTLVAGDRCDFRYGEGRLGDPPQQTKR